MTIQYRPRGQCSPCKIRTAVSPRIAVLPCLVLPCPPQLSGSPYLLAPSLSISLSYLPFIFLPSPSSFPRVLFPFIFLSLPRRSPLPLHHHPSLLFTRLAICDSYIRLLDLPSWNGESRSASPYFAPPLAPCSSCAPQRSDRSSHTSSVIIRFRVLQTARCCFPSSVAVRFPSSTPGSPGNNNTHP